MNKEEFEQWKERRIHYLKGQTKAYLLAGPTIALATGILAAGLSQYTQNFNLKDASNMTYAGIALGTIAALTSIIPWKAKRNLEQRTYEENPRRNN